MVNEHGRLSERYEYTPYGQRITFSAVPLIADFNSGGSVDVGDLSILATYYGESDKEFEEGDTNGDRDVDVGDLSILSGLMGSNVLGYTGDRDTVAYSSPTKEDPMRVSFAGIGSARTYGSGSPVLCPFGFQGLLHDEQIQVGPSASLVYNRARYWHPTLGRFMARDPLGYVDGMSLYAGYHVMHGGVDWSGTLEVDPCQTGDDEQPPCYRLQAPTRPDGSCPDGYVKTEVVFELPNGTVLSESVCIKCSMGSCSVSCKPRYQTRYTPEGVKVTEAVCFCPD